MVFQSLVCDAEVGKVEVCGMYILGTGLTRALSTLAVFMYGAMMLLSRRRASWGLPRRAKEFQNSLMSLIGAGPC